MGYDEAYELPTEEAVTLSLRTQQIIAHESGVADTVDPLAGSYFVESLTDKIERDALDYIERIDEMGGVVAAIETGFQQREIAEASYKYQAQVDTKEKTIVGVNKYGMQDDQRPATLKIGEETEQAQLERLASVKRERDDDAVRDALSALRSAAEDGGNLLPKMLDAVRAYATVGEVCQALVPVFGTYREVSVI